MPLQKTGRLPKRYARRVTKNTRKLVERRYERQKQFRKERFRRWWRRMEQVLQRWQRWAVRWFVVLIAGFVLLIFGLVLFSPLFQVQEIRVQRYNPRLDVEKVQQVLAPLFGRHLFFIQNKEIDALLRSDISDVRDVRVQKKYPSTISVAVELDPLVARLEIVEPDTQGEVVSSGAVLDYLTDKGVYIHAVVQSADILPMVRIVDWSVRPTPGTVAVDPALLARLWDTETALRQQFGHDVTIRSIYLRAQEYHLYADGVSLWFDMRSSLELQLQRYRVFLQHIPRTDVQQYIDLRLTDRVVYK